MRGGLAAGANAGAVGSHLAGVAGIENNFAQMMEARAANDMAMAGNIGAANQASINAANQFNAGARNDLSQFNAGLTTQNNQCNAGVGAKNAQFNAQGAFGANRARRDDYLDAVGAAIGARA